MGKPLRVLIVEDSEDDAVLLVHMLEHEGYEVTYERVDTVDGMSSALKNDPWDLIISDYNMPTFDAPSALRLFQETGLDLPFIVISGTVGEEVAVKTMVAGAHDYMMKDKLRRFVPAVKRELAEAEMRRKRREAEKALHISALQWQATFDAMVDGVFLLNNDQKITKCNSAMVKLAGKIPDEMLGHQCWEVMHGTESPIEECPHVRMMESGQREIVELAVGDKVFLVTADPVRDTDGQIVGSVHIMKDITESRETLHRVKSSESRLNFLVSSTPAVIYTAKAGGDYGATFISETVRSQLGYEPDTFLQNPDFWATNIHPDDVQRVFEGLTSLSESDHHVHEYRFQHRNGDWRWLRDEVRLIRNDDGSPREIIGCMMDITERKQSEEARKKLLHDMAERVKELDCLYAASSLLTQVDRPLNEILKDIVDLIPPAWQFPEITCAKIVYGEHEFVTPSFKETAWCQSSDIMVFTEKVGFVQVCYLKESPPADEGPFLKEERDLIDDLGRQIGIAMERSNAEKGTKEQLRRLEIFYKASVGREERILELKKEIEQLKKEPKKHENSS